MLEKLKGKKTYLTMAVMIVLGAISGWNDYCAGADVVTFCREIKIPGLVFSILGGLGVYTRSVVGK